MKNNTIKGELKSQSMIPVRPTMRNMKESYQQSDMNQ